MEDKELQVVSNLGAELTSDENSSLIVDLTTPRKTAFSSVDITKATMDEKKKFFNAINSSDKRLADEINKEINLKHVYVEEVQLTNKETGELQSAPRIVLIDDKGDGFSCVSSGVFNSLKKLFGTFGVPTSWEKPIKVRVKQITKASDRKILTLEIA
jgi:hypothetical protein